jgi:UDP-N-acetylglucosamine--N-acetylmuramyl-(pentapeptide) pyrophosphoryl-undecaprenol N-acetylglucosamine transferase
MASSSGLEVRHQAGAAHADVCAEYYKELGLAAEVNPFILDMAEAYAWSDLVVCRAGALTVAELTAAGRASVLIPFPHAIDDHQTKNGEWLVANGAAELHSQSDLSAAKMQEIIETYMNDRKRLKLMGAKAHGLALPDAAKQVADICMEIINA